MQQLTALGYNVERASMHAESGNATKAAEILNAVKQDLSSQVRDLRRMMVELRPPALDQVGLPAALKDYVTDFARRHDVKASIDIDENTRLSPALETTVYRVTQEALTNVSKHAEASSIDVQLAREGRSMVLTVRDNGRGFDVANVAPASEEHFGLDGMEQRIKIAGGEWDIASHPGEGTTVRARIPVGSGCAA